MHVLKWELGGEMNEWALSEIMGCFATGHFENMTLIGYYKGMVIYQGPFSGE